MGVIVHIVGDFIDARQRVQDFHVGLGVAQHGGTEDIHVLHALVFHEVGETLALHAGHIYNVGLGDDLLVEIGLFLVLDALLAAVGFEFLGHREFFGGDEMESRVEMAHGHNERMHRAPVLQVAHKENVQVVEFALRLVDAVKVEQGLRGVLVCAVAGVDHGHGRHFRGIFRRAFEIMAHHNDIGVIAHHHNGVFERLALRGTGHLGVGKADDFRAEAVGCRFKGEAGARGGFKKESGYDTSVQKFAVGTFLKFLPHADKIEDFFLGEVGNGN